MGFCEIISKKNGAYKFKVGDKNPTEYFLDIDLRVFKVGKDGSVNLLTNRELESKPWLKKTLIGAIRYEARCGLYQTNQSIRKTKAYTL